MKRKIAAYRFEKKHFKNETLVADFLEGIGIIDDEIEIEDKSHYWEFTLFPHTDIDKTEHAGLGVISVFAVVDKKAEKEKQDEKKMETHDIAGVEIFRVGSWTSNDGKKTNYTEADLQGMAGAMKELEGHFEAPLKIGHNEKQNLKNEEMPSLGWLHNFRVKGNALICDLKGVPKALYDIIKTGAYKKRSLEIWENYYDESLGKKFKKVVCGLALLGAQIPALGSLADITGLFDTNSGASIFLYDYDDDEVVVFDDKTNGGGDLDMAEIDELKKKLETQKSEFEKVERAKADTEKQLEAKDKELSEQKVKFEQESKDKETKIAEMDKERGEREEKARQDFMTAELSKKVQPKHNAIVLEILKIADGSDSTVKFSKEDGKDEEIPVADGIRSFLKDLSDHPAFDEKGKVRGKDDKGGEEKDEDEAKVQAYMTEHKLDPNNHADYMKACTDVLEYTKPKGMGDAENDTEEV